jgi:NAD-dependent DNA ligase
MSSHAHHLRKSCEALLGICTGIIADDTLNEREVKFLNLWLLDNQDISTVWPGEILAKRINEVLSDGIVTQDELVYLKQTIEELIGGTLQQTGAISGLSTRMPLNDDLATPVIFNDNAFCFTGNFLYGTRAACERAIMQRGGTAFDGVRKNLEYLVIGTMINEDWANTSYGRKIEKAVEYQNKGSSVLIISEDHWVKHL